MTCFTTSLPLACRHKRRVFPVYRKLTLAISVFFDHCSQGAEKRAVLSIWANLKHFNTHNQGKQDFSFVVVLVVTNLLSCWVRKNPVILQVMMTGETQTSDTRHTVTNWQHLSLMCIANYKIHHHLHVCILKLVLISEFGWVLRAKRYETSLKTFFSLECSAPLITLKADDIPVFNLIHDWLSGF